MLGVQMIHPLVFKIMLAGFFVAGVLTITWSHMFRDAFSHVRQSSHAGARWPVTQHVVAGTNQVFKEP